MPLLGKNNKNMKLGKIKKFTSASSKERKAQLSRVASRIYIKALPFFRILKLPFVSSKERRNLSLDLVERVTNLGPVVRHRYYLGFKLFYSCLDEVGTGIVNNTMCDRVYEKETCTFLEQSIKGVSNPVFIDVGANIGLISLYMLKHVPDITIHAFEPSPHQYGLFKRTLEENHIRAIHLFDSALSNKEGEVSFFAHDTGCPADGFIDTGRGGVGKTIKVKTTPLDAWWANNGRPKVDLIKADTEGAELLIFKGAKEVLETFSPVVFFEMQEVNYKVYDYDWRDVLQFFESIGYSVYTEDGEKFDFNNGEMLMTDNYNFIAKKLI
jgi:FkbM family methyltransferase